MDAEPDQNQTRFKKKNMKKLYTIYHKKKINVLELIIWIKIYGLN
jgi:hypothetical protein